MKKLFLFLSMLLAMGLSSACSSDEENPFVGEWQLVEIRNVAGGEITYPTDEDDGAIRIDYIKFLPNFEFKAFGKDMPTEDFPPMTYSYDKGVLTLKLVYSGYYSYKYEISDNRNLLKIIPFMSDMDPGIVPYATTMRTYKRIK